MIPAGGPVYTVTPNSITLRADFAACVRKIDACHKIVETAPGVATLTSMTPTRTGNTWTIPQALAGYPVGNRPNTWRISLTRAPPAPATYHWSIMQTFVRTTDYGTGKTYPPTTRR